VQQEIETIQVVVAPQREPRQVQFIYTNAPVAILILAPWASQEQIKKIPVLVATPKKLR
jgi:hypothetical protein